jgi:hypothetical protein
MLELIADAIADNCIWLSYFVFCLSSQSVGQTAVCPASASSLYERSMPAKRIVLRSSKIWGHKTVVSVALPRDID